MLPGSHFLLGGKINKMELTSEYAQRLFETGAFVIISDLPSGSEVGIDGECVRDRDLIEIP